MKSLMVSRLAPISVVAVAAGVLMLGASPTPTPPHASEGGGSSGPGFKAIEGRLHEDPDVNEKTTADEVVDLLNSLGAGSTSAKVVYSAGDTNYTTVIWRSSGGNGPRWTFKKHPGRPHEDPSGHQTPTGKSIAQDLEAYGKVRAEQAKVVYCGGNHNYTYVFYPLE